MQRPNRKQRRIVILLLAALSFGIAYLGGNRVSTPDFSNVSGVILQPPMKLPEIKLQNQAGDAFDNRQLAGHWSLFLLDPVAGLESPGFRRLIQVHNRLADDPELQANHQFIYLPRDNTEAVMTAIGRLGTNFTALQGETAEVDRLFTALGVMDSHQSAVLYLIDPDRKLRVMFTGSQDAATIAADITTVTSQHR